MLVLSQYVEPTYAGELIADGAGGIGYLLNERVGDARAFLDTVKRIASLHAAHDRKG